MSPILSKIADHFGYRICPKPEGGRGNEWLPKADFRECIGCDDDYHKSWDPPDFSPERARRDTTGQSGGLCPNCSGAS